MKQEDKELLLKDLCARLPYGVKIDVIYSKDSGSSLRARLCSEGINILDTNILWLFQQSEVYIKPYLFPMSSMTEEQKKEYYSLADDVTIKPGQGSYFGIKIHCIKLGISDNPHEEVWDYIDLDALDWLNKNHFDYRGLIERGLAIDCTDLNIY